MQVTELAMLVMLPNWLVQWKVVKPMRYMVAGTMLVGHTYTPLRWAATASFSNIDLVCHCTAYDCCMRVCCILHIWRHVQD